jgi:hypothetical protein
MMQAFSSMMAHYMALHGRLCVCRIIEQLLALLPLWQVLFEKLCSIGQEKIWEPISYRIQKQGFSDAMQVDHVWKAGAGTHDSDSTQQFH